jgi:hypothetical protein
VVGRRKSHLQGYDYTPIVLVWDCHCWLFPDTWLGMILVLSGIGLCVYSKIAVWVLLARYQKIWPFGYRTVPNGANYHIQFD